MDKGIIFSAPMVRALLDGRKIQTRRLIKPQPAENVTSAGVYSNSCEGVKDEWTWLSGDPRDCDAWGYEGDFKIGYVTGGRLYVREAYSIRGVYSDVVEVGYRAHQNASHTEFVEQWPVDHAKDAKGKRPVVTWPSYKPSIHMPRWASRLWLGVTDVRVQRLQEISEEDALAEGIIEYEPTMEDPSEFSYVDGGDIWNNARSAFAALWNSLHTEPGERWDDNPWVVAVTFDVNQGNIDAVATQ